MSNEQKNINDESKEPEVFILEQNSSLKLLLILGGIGFLAAGIFTISEPIQYPLILFFFSFLSLYTLLAYCPTVKFDNQRINFNPVIGRRSSFSWNEIQGIDGHPLFEAISVFTKEGKKFTISGQYQKYLAFETHLRHLRRDLFTSSKEQVFRRKIVVSIFLIGVIAGGIMISPIGSGWIMGVPVIFSGLLFLLWSPYKLILKPTNEIILQSYLKTYHFTPRDIDISVATSEALADRNYQIFISPRGQRGNFSLNFLSNSKALLFAKVRTWWEERIPFLAIPIGYKEYGPCECCGNTSLTVWGDLQEKEELAAVYYVHWTHKQPDHGAAFDLIIGKFGEDTTTEDRYAVSLAYRIHEGVPQFMVIDASQRPISGSEFVGISFTRDQVINSPLKNRIFSMVDEIFMQDNRIAELRSK